MGVSFLDIFLGGAGSVFDPQLVESADAEPPGGAAAGKLRKPRRGPRGPQGAARLFPVIPCQSACCSLPSGRTGRPSCRLAPTPGLRPAAPGRSFSSRQPRLRRPPSTLSGAVASRLTVSVAKMGCSCTSVPGYCACPWQAARLSLQCTHKGAWHVTEVPPPLGHTLQDSQIAPKPRVAPNSMYTIWFSYTYL